MSVPVRGRLHARTPSVAVIGAGWGGLAAAVELIGAGHAVTLFEMAARPGGRARSIPLAQGNDEDDASARSTAPPLDNGQHILIGAYCDTLALMRRVGVDPGQVLQRLPLTLCGPDGRGMRLPAGPAAIAFVRGVLGCRHWPWPARWALLRAAAGWARQDFRCDDALSVAQLCAGLPTVVRSGLIDPLCIAALNTPAPEASAGVFLRVLRDGLLGGRGAADLLLPRRPLATLLPEPACAWLRAAGATLHFGHRVVALSPLPRARWAVDGLDFDAAVLATTAGEAVRLTAGLAPGWADCAAALRHEPIATVYLRADGARLPAPMVTLVDGPDAPAQFVFDHGALGGPAGRLACVVSGAADWVARGRDALAAAAIAQLQAAFPPSALPQTPTVERVLVEKRATFRCTPGLHRPPMRIRPGLLAAGDYVAGPYPATLEACVRSGVAAGMALTTGH
ncbi:MAG: hydroxysqualene dehydroxylase HpnE [Rubrivivax sp.]